MKAFNVVLTEDAAADLQDIIAYIDAQDGPIRADHVLDQYEKVLTKLETLPGKHLVVSELRDIGIVDFREALFKPYRVIFRIEGASVFVLLICDGRRDVTTLLNARLLRG
jgi:toxin ParE1/3/4